MGARVLAVGYLQDHFPPAALGLAHCQIAAAIRQLSDAERAKALSAIPSVMAWLRAGKARKKGEVGTIARIGLVARAVGERIHDVEAVVGEVSALQGALGSAAKNAPGELLNTALNAGVAELSRLASPGCQQVSAAIGSASALSAAVGVLNTARNVGELIREIQVLWNSVIDLSPNFNFDFIEDAALDELETRLALLINAVADEGEAQAAAFTNQKLDVTEWFKGAS